MHCKISDCFNCPYPDCINDSFYDYKLSDKQKARHNELALGRLEQRRANGICTYCGKNPADKGYKTCAECRRKTDAACPRLLQDEEKQNRTGDYGRNKPMQNVWEKTAYREKETMRKVL